MPAPVILLPFRSARYSGGGLPARSMRWPQSLGAELRQTGICIVGRGVAIPLGSQVGILNGQVALDREVAMFRRTLIVNSRPMKRGNDMLTIRSIALFVGATLAIVTGPIRSEAQSAPATDEPDSVSIHISLEKSTFAIGEKPIGVLAIKNISSSELCLSTDPHLYRIQVKSKDAEPPKTELHRHLRGEFRPGDGPELASGPIDCRSIAPGSVDSLKFDLSAFYDLSKPGDYSVYLEIYDPAGPKDGSGHWLRTNTAKFTIQTPTQ